VEKITLIKVERKKEMIAMRNFGVCVIMHLQNKLYTRKVGIKLIIKRGNSTDSYR
jgi:hypothetical protein